MAVSLGCSPAVSKVLLDDYVRKLSSGTGDAYDLLTPREREVLQLIAEGKSNKDVANLLNLTVYTVESYRSNLMEKLNLRGLPEVILYAVRKGIIFASAYRFCSNPGGLTRRFSVI